MDYQCLDAGRRYSIYLSNMTNFSTASTHLQSEQNIRAISRILLPCVSFIFISVH